MISYLTYNTSFQSIAISQDDKYAFVMGGFEKLVISLTTNSVVQQFSAGGTNVACNGDGSIFYVTDYFNGTVRVYNKTGSTGLTSQQSNEAFVRLFPNTSLGIVNLEVRGFDLSDAKLALFDLVGRVGLEKPVESVLSTISLDGLSRGLYHYRFRSGTDVVSGQMVIE